MSALPSKADICGVLAHVRFGPIADIIMRRLEFGRGCTYRDALLPRQSFFLTLLDPRWTEPPFGLFFICWLALGSCHSAPKPGILAPPPPTPHANAADGHRVANMGTAAIGMPNRIRMEGLLLLFVRAFVRSTPKSGHHAAIDNAFPIPGKRHSQTQSGS